MEANQQDFIAKDEDYWAEISRIVQREVFSTMYVIDKNKMEVFGFYLR